MSYSLQKENPILLLLVSVFLVSFLGLMLQIGITRVFSTIIWYHYAFVAISIALFGWGLGGLALHFVSHKIHGKELSFITGCLLLLSVFMPFYLLSIAWIPAYPSSTVIYFLVSLVPLFLAGICLALIYSRFTKSVSKLYFADLAGASFACVAGEPILYAFGAEATILLLGVLATIPSIVISLSSKKRRLLGLSLIVLVASSTVFTFNLQSSIFSVSNVPTKQMFRLIRDNSNLRIVSTKWNSFSRVDVVEGFNCDRQALIFIDADASTEVIRWDGNVDSLQYLKQSLGMLPYSLVKNPKSLIIGPGGGKDVLFAIAANSSKIVGVELNPIIVDIVRNYKEAVGNIYDNASRAEIHVDEGRSFVSRSSDRFDVIMLTLVDSWAAVYAGGYALAENYLYTKEAFGDYLNHLTDEGLLMMVRWKSEIPRLVSTAVAASGVQGQNLENVGQRIAIVLHELEPDKIEALFILKKTPFTQADAERLRDQTMALGSAYKAFYIPYTNDKAEPYHSLFNGSISSSQFDSSFNQRIDAVSDDSPFYFNFEYGVPSILGGLITLSSALSIAFIVIPFGLAFWKNNRRKEQTAFSSSAYSFIPFFSALGIGYMLIEIALIQKFILFLGYPTRALATTLFSLLLSSGIGSFVSGHLAHTPRSPIKNVLVSSSMVITVITIYAFLLPSLLVALLPESTLIRMLTVAALLFPLGFFMGIPFPSGLHILNTRLHQNISWMWAVNGAASVLGSVLATVTAILYGFSYALVFGAAAYFIALVCALAWWFK